MKDGQGAGANTVEIAATLNVIQSNTEIQVAGEEVPTPYNRHNNYKKIHIDTS